MPDNICGIVVCLLMSLLYRHQFSEVFGIVLDKLFTLVTFTLTADNVLFLFIYAWILSG